MDNLRILTPLDIAAREFVKLSRISHVNKFGRNSDIDTGTDPEDVWDSGSLWVPPVAAITHNIVSTDVDDDGDMILTGTADAGSNSTTLIDSGFTAAGVAAGDTVLNDTNMDHATVISNDSDTQLTLEISYHTGDPSHSGTGESGFNTGDTYRIVSPASTGATVIHVFGLDANMTPQEEFVVLDGQVNVLTSGTYYRIFRMHIDGAASRTVSNEGDITATTNDGATTVTAQINTGIGQTLMAIYTIPAGKTGYITSFYAAINKVLGVTTGSADISLIETPVASIDGLGSRTKHRSSLSQHGSSHIQHMFNPYKKILANTDIVLRVEEVSSNDTDVSGGFDIILVDH